MAESYALMRNARSKYVLGSGAYESFPECPDKDTAFYLNDFSLSSEAPWKVFEHVQRVERFDELQLKMPSPPSVKWKEVTPEPFAEVFAQVSENIQHNTIQKSVPVVTEVGEIEEGEIDQLIFSTTPDKVHHAYAWSDSASGFCGLTPEVLFSYEKGRLKTMALAGTAHISEKSIFSVDQKEIQEHEFVAKTLISKLNEIGMVQPESRRILELQSLVHFHTPIFVGLYDAMPMESLIERLHPTPALGPLPKTESSLKDLSKWREQLDCPPAFGAPMGVWDEGEFHAVVCIRGVHWQGNQIKLPAGCGVTEPSRLTNEWRELQLKRESVKSLFSL